MLHARSRKCTRARGALYSIPYRILQHSGVQPPIDALMKRKLNEIQPRGEEARDKEMDTQWGHGYRIGGDIGPEA